jgi:hypothetical protein
VALLRELPAREIVAFQQLLDELLAESLRYTLWGTAVLINADCSQYGLSLAVGGGLPMLPIVLLPFVGTDPQVAAALSLLFLAPAVAALALAAHAGRLPR